MSKLLFTTAASTLSSPYRGRIGMIRTELQKIASFVEKNPGSKASIKGQFQVFATAMGWTLT